MFRTLPVRWYVLILFGIVLANFFLYRHIFAPPLLIVHVLEVGKGDAVLVRTPSGETVLVDTGPNASIVRALGTALPPWKRHIDGVILTSMKSSHIGGLLEVEKRYQTSPPLIVGTKSLPYGTRFSLDPHVSMKVIAPATISIAYGAGVLSVSSSTQASVYTSDGTSFIQK